MGLHHTPGSSLGDPSVPITELPALDLTSVGNGRYEGIFGGFTSFGAYRVSVFAMDTEGGLSMPTQTLVFQGTGPDAYEEDDAYWQASVIAINDPSPQTHGFHDEGDKDWVEFFGIEEEVYTIETSTLGSQCDTVIELYDTDGSTMLLSEPKDDGGPGQDEVLDWSCPADGIYYVRIGHYDPQVFGDHTEYDLAIYKPIGPLSGFVTGVVSDADTGTPLRRVTLRTNVSVTAITESQGNYFMVHPPGTYTITATYDGYHPRTVEVSVDEAEMIAVDIGMENANGGQDTWGAATAEASGPSGSTAAKHQCSNLLAMFALPFTFIVVWRRSGRRIRGVNAFEKRRGP